MSEEQLSDAEKKLFKALERERTPPGHLERNIITQLEKEGLIKKTIAMNNYFKWAAQLAAAILLFVGGMFYGKSNTTNTMVEIEPTKGYMLILHEDASFSPGEPMAMFEEYKTWMENTFSRGIKITGQELKNEATVVKTGSQQELGDEADIRTTGYFLVEANSYQDAVAVAKENPHIKYGGSIEVKPFMVR